MYDDSPRDECFGNAQTNPRAYATPLASIREAGCERDPIELLAAEFVDRHRAGETPSIEDYVGEHPELADEIRELFPTIARLESLKNARCQSPRGLAAAGLPRAARLGGFRILREIGRGGMGIVYEAEDCALKRRVALKVLGANVAGSPIQRERFQHEAEAAARLHHTHIVPVFGTGQEHGVLFYVMQFIDGMSLAEVIERLRAQRAPEACEALLAGVAQGSAAEEKERGRQGEKGKKISGDLSIPRSPCLPLSLSPCLAPTASNADLGTWLDWKTTVRVGIQLSEALACAHGQGVLHRDVKGANVLVDRNGQVWIADFGLAKHDGRAGVTATGNLVGTLRYMAPEQFQGQTDARSDIYSLGLTLYELVTLQPAFPESREAQLVQQKTTAPISSPRFIRKDIPRDLETILLKACALEPLHRYQSAAELAEDLRRLQQDRPILARRVWFFERLWRWSRRNRATAGLMGLAALLLVALAVTFAVGNYRTNAALTDAVDAARAADTERRRAQDNLDVALRAMDEMMGNISERGIPQTIRIGLSNGPVSLEHVAVSPADAALLQSLLRFFDEFASKNGTNLDHQTAGALRRIGEIQQRLGRLPEAEAAFLQSLEIASKLIPSAAADARPLTERAALWNAIGMVRSQRGDVSAAFAAHREALELLESPLAQKSDDGRFQMAETLNLLGTVGSRAGGAEMVPEMFGAHIRERGGPRFGRDEPPLTPPPIDRDEALERGAAILKELLERDPENAAWQFALAKNYRSRIRLGPSHRSTAAETRHVADQAIRILKDLAARFPDSPVYAYELASTLGRSAQRLPELEPADRDALQREALQLAARLAFSHPHVPEYQALVAATERRLGWLAHRRGEAAEAREHYRTALELHGRLSREYPAVSLYQVGYAQALSDWAQVLAAADETDAARESMNKALAIARTTAESWKDDPLFRDFVAHLESRQRAIK